MDFLLLFDKKISGSQKRVKDDIRQRNELLMQLQANFASEERKIRNLETNLDSRSIFFLINYKN